MSVSGAFDAGAAPGITTPRSVAPVATYYVALGKNPVGAEELRGDDRTPEGVYRIEARNARSDFHLSLRAPDPSTADVVRSRRLGVDPGGDIMIHDLPPRFSSVGAQHRAYDWTNGGIAVTDKEIEEIFAAVSEGAVIHIRA